MQHEQQTMKEEETCSPQSPSNMSAVTRGDMRIELKDTQPNGKTLSVIIRELKSCESRKPVFTFQEIADSLGYEARQNTNNFYREFHANGEDFLALLSRQKTLKEQTFPLIEAQVLESPWLAPHEHSVAFCEHFPAISLSESTFREYVNDIESVKILNRRKHSVSRAHEGLNAEVSIRELLDLATLFPLLIELYPSCDEVSWTLCFQHFKALYGQPRLLLRDGSLSLAAARTRVFKHVRCQLCTFHNVKNLMKQIRKHVQERSSTARRCSYRGYGSKNSWSMVGNIWIPPLKWPPSICQHCVKHTLIPAKFFTFSMITTCLVSKNWDKNMNGSNRPNIIGR